MIQRAGVIYQDIYSLGFLQGLKRRLGCDAELIPPTGSVGRSRNMTRRQARNAWLFFQSQRVQIVVRFTDADQARWQDVRRDEITVFPPDAQAVTICGVAVNNCEEWLFLDPDFLEKQLGVNAASLRNEPERSAALKRAIDRHTASDEMASQVVERLVAEAPADVFRRWLAEPSFRSFYTDCRSIASRFECQTSNEL